MGGAALIARIALLALVVAPLAGAVERAAAWWETFRLDPTGGDVFGVPVAAIDGDWRSARALGTADFDAAQRAELDKRGLTFQLQGDFNDDGHPDRAVVGTYADRRGKTGRFVAIFTQYTSTWTRAYRETVEGEPGFGALSRDTAGTLDVGRIRWTRCVGCTPDEIAWNGTGYFLMPGESVPRR